MSALGQANTKFSIVRYFEHGASGSGEEASNPAAIESADLFAIPAGTLVEQAYVYIETAVTGSTAIDIGDDDDPDGFIPTASLTLGTPAVYGFGPDEKGAYLAATGEQRSKFYSASGKEAKIAVTGASTAGKFRVCIEGRYTGE